jgi:acetyl-CoA synthetase
VLKAQGVNKGDRVCIYMPMIPELAIAVLACARIGAIHSVVFGGFSAQSISDRVNDSQCKLVITTDGAVRGNKTIPMKETVDDALLSCPCVETVIVKIRTKTPISMLKGRDLWWEEEEMQASGICAPEAMNAEDPLFILYTSGSTGKPKGVVHTCGGYMVYTAYTFANVFQYNLGDVFFCTADIGWITGHSYFGII